MISIYTILIGGVLFLLIYYLTRNKKNYPKGPWRLPYIGNLLQVGGNPSEIFDQWAKKYGKFFSIKLGSANCIVINDPKIIREAFNENALSGRPDLIAFNILANGMHGIIESEGEEWEEQRRFTLRHLRDFGFASHKDNYSENLIMEEVKEFLTNLKKEEGKPTVLNNRFRLAVLNSLWFIITGNRFAQDDPKLNEILKTTNETFNEIAENGIGLFMPWVLEWFPNWTGWTKGLKNIKIWLGLFYKEVREHQKSFSKDAEPRDFIDAYLKEIENTTDINSSFHKLNKSCNGEGSLIAVIGDLFGAGSETTSVTLSWAILYLLTHQDIQKKFQEEIDTVVGNRLPSLSDKSKMPYTEAIIAEILRISSITPIGLFHTAMKDFKFYGYDIPKNSFIIGNFKYVHFDPQIWGDPDNFRPERHLATNKDGTMKFIKNENIMAFSVGKRACIGETLARDELFLFLTSILQRFSLLTDPENPKPSFVPDKGFLNQPRDFTLILKDRIEN